MRVVDDELGGDIVADNFVPAVTGNAFGGDVPPVTILRELQRVETVRLLDGDDVEVLRRNYRLDAAEPEALIRAGSVVEDIGKTVTHNLYRAKSEPSRFEARASNVNIPASALPAYRTFINSESQAFLERVDDWLSRHETAGQAHASGAARPKAIRLGIGMYWIQSDSHEESQS